MPTISQPRGQWVARVSGHGTLPVLSAADLNDGLLALTWRTRDARDTTLAQKQFEAVVRQLTAGNPARKVTAVVVDGAGKARDGARRLFEFTLANLKVTRFTNGTATYNYLLTDGRELA